MKRYIALTTSILMFSNVCMAYTSCKGGSEIQAKNGTKFCMSTNVMTWYAAHAWCHANGGRMATQQKVCLNSTASGTCNNIKDSVTENAWGFTNYSTTNSIGRVHLKDGRNNTTNPINRKVKDAPTGEPHTYGGITDMHALCE